jgi:hypothetical protein
MTEVGLQGPGVASLVSSSPLAPPLHPHPYPAPVLGDELDAGLFEGHLNKLDNPTMRAVTLSLISPLVTGPETAAK